MAQEIIADIVELQQFLQLSKRPNVKQYLEKQLDELKQKQALLGQSSVPSNTTTVTSASELPIPTPMKVEKVSVDLPYNTITSYSWDQTNDTVKILVSLDNVGTLSPENVQVEFKLNTVDIKVHGLNNQNYRFSRTLNEITPEECSFKIRPNRIVLALKKKETGHWDKLESKKEKKKPDISNKDPNAGIMELMKNMYEEGDDEMKRTIAKAWTESREKKGLDV